jgi:hypothetical protein
MLCLRVASLSQAVRHRLLPGLTPARSAIPGGLEARRLSGWAVIQHRAMAPIIWIRALAIQLPASLLAPHPANDKSKSKLLLMSFLSVTGLPNSL